MDTSAPVNLVKLVVKNVYTPSQTLALSVRPQTRVGELKQRLQQEFPEQPAPSAQKLIFGGKICRDEEPLEQVLAQVQSSHLKDGDGGDEPVVFHLLVTSTGARSHAEAPKPKTPEPPHPEAAEAADSPRPSRRAVETPRFNPPQAPASTPTQFPFQQPNMSQQQQNLYRQSVLMQQQAMVLTQIQYLQYLLMQQRQADAALGAQQQQQAFGAHFGAPYGNFYGMMPPQMFQAQAQARPNAAPQAAPAPVPAAQAAPETPAEPQRRPLIVEMAREVFPLLDFRMALKMAFMLFIIGQDTPMDRILMLALLSFISYLHITGIFAKIYEVYNRRRSQNGDAANAPADSNAPGAAAAAGAAIRERYGMLTHVLRISSDRGFVQDVKYFVVGLLLSLVPAWHPQPLQGAAPMHENAMPDGAGDVPLQGI